MEIHKNLETAWVETSTILKIVIHLSMPAGCVKKLRLSIHLCVSQKMDGPGDTRPLFQGNLPDQMELIEA